MSAMSDNTREHDVTGEIAPHGEGAVAGEAAGVGEAAKVGEGEGAMQAFVFPLPGMVFFPSTTIPLNIFEPRYIQMVNDAVASQTPLALTMDVPGEEGEGRGRKVIAGFGEVSVAKRNPDGTMVILVKGQGRVELDEVVQQTPYIACMARVVSEVDDLDWSHRGQVKAFREMLSAWADEHIPSADHRRMLLHEVNEPKKLVECIASLMVRDPAARQAILETSDINERVTLIEALLSASLNLSGAGLTPSEVSPVEDGVVN